MRWRWRGCLEWNPHTLALSHTSDTTRVVVHHLFENHAPVAHFRTTVSHSPTPTLPTAPVSQHLPVTSPLPCRPVRDWTCFLFLFLSKNSRMQTVGHCLRLVLTRRCMLRCWSYLFVFNYFLFDFTCIELKGNCISFIVLSVFLINRLMFYIKKQRNSF